MDINSTAPTFRQILLGRNIVSDSVSNNGLEALTQGIGSFVSIGHGTPNVHPSEDLELIGNLYRDLMIVNNKHQGSLDERRRISIVTIPNAEAGDESYKINYADLIEDSLLRKDLNIINNKYRNVLGEDRIIDIKLFQSLTPSNIEYGVSSSKLGIDDKSVGYRKANTTKSMYLDWDAQLLKDIVTTPVVTNKSLPNYLTRTTGIVGSNKSVTTAASIIIGSILGGTQPTYQVGSPNPIFEIQGALGNSDINETPLGIAAAQGLSNSIRYNIGANLYEETIGNINTNPLSVLMGNSIIVPNYSITVAKGTFGGLLDYTEKILGFQVPVSLLAQSSSIFQSENPVANILRANSMIENTGKGQILSLFANLRASLLSSNNVKSGYAPGFVDKRNPNGGINPNIYAFYDNTGGVIDLLHGVDNNPISQSNYNEGLAKAAGFEGLTNVKSEILGGTSRPVDFTWGDQYKGVFTNKDFNKKSILFKTSYLFRQGGKMVNLTTGKFAKTEQGETNTTVDSAAGSVISRGSAVRKFNGRVPESDPEKMFTRAWTTFDRYDKVSSLQKSSGLNWKAGTNQRWGMENSVLGDNGFVKIGPYGDQQGGAEILDNPNLRNYMFSIENLAWADVSATKLIQSEIGPGDPITGKKGRIMWFPPYEMNFNDNTSVDWEQTNFIGRGEPIYTYNNTTRIGTLQFKIIIDHPSYMNNLKGESDQLIDAFFAGSFDVDDRVKSKLSTDEINSMEIKSNNKIEEVNHQATLTPDPYSVYFPFNTNTIQEVNNDYENGVNFNFVTNPMGLGEGVGSYTTMDGITIVDNTNYTLNDIYWEAINDLDVKMRECPACKITIKTFGVNGENDLARFQRAKVIYDEIVSIVDPNDPVKNKRYVYEDGGNTPVQLINSTTGLPLADFGLNIKQAIKVSVSFQFDSKLAEELNPNKKQLLTPFEPNNVLNPDIKSRFYNEVGFFKKLEQDDKVVYDSISDKIAFFHPAFHSITPEGFNSRLTFLQQCTRQGPTIAANTPDNLAFGRPPVCILRIGDFYHTKIVIDNLSFSYEPLVWDLNPEGVGVQPMIATVDMQFSFIGGSSMRGPINRLQNAVSFNFFANTEIYDPRADTILTQQEPTKGTSGTIINGTDPDNSGNAAKSSNGGGNTNAATANQAAVAIASTAPTVPPVTAPSGDANALQNSTLMPPYWTPILTLKVIDVAITNDWSVKLEVNDYINNQKKTIKEFPSITNLIDSDNNLVLDTGLIIYDIDEFTQEIASPTNPTIMLTYVMLFLTFHRNGEAKITKSEKAYYD